MSGFDRLWLALERFWVAPISAVRAWLVQRTFLLLFAFDTIADHLRPAWRYGSAGFNVAHAPIFALLPTPTSELYVGAMFVLAIASFVVALSPRPPRALMALIAALYFWSWTSSMHDSYQHHYLLSLFFLAFAFLPPLSSWDLFGAPGLLAAPATKAIAKRANASAAPSRSPRRTIAVGLAALVAAGAAWWSGPLGRVLVVIAAGVAVLLWADLRLARSEREGWLVALPHTLTPRASAFVMPLVWTTTAIVYLYTAISKTEPEWRNGDALRDLTRNGATIPEALELFGSIGLEGDRLWWFLGHSVIALQLACALGYVTAPLRDRAEGAWRAVLDGIAYLALVLALSFHLGAEYMGLQIGWFSWYMILLALGTFVPERVLAFAVLLLTWPLRELREHRERHPSPNQPNPNQPSPIVAAVLALIAGAALLPVGVDADLPGALGACVLAGVAMLGAGLYVATRGQHADDVRAGALAVLFAAAMIPFSLRVLGGDAEVGPSGRPEPHHDVRYDYWRFAGGDFRRRGEWARALDAYVHANRHAPEGRDRREQEDQMRARVRAEGPRRAE